MYVHVLVTSHRMIPDRHMHLCAHFYADNTCRVWLHDVMSGFPTQYSTCTFRAVFDKEAGMANYHRHSPHACNLWGCDSCVRTPPQAFLTLVPSYRQFQAPQSVICAHGPTCTCIAFMQRDTMCGSWVCLCGNCYKEFWNDIYRCYHELFCLLGFIFPISVHKPIPRNKEFCSVLFFCVYYMYIL